MIGGIKGQSRVGTRVYQYVALNEVYNTTYASYNPFPTWYKQIVAKKWWLYPTYTAGTPVTEQQSSQ